MVGYVQAKPGHFREIPPFFPSLFSQVKIVDRLTQYLIRVYLTCTQMNSFQPHFSLHCTKTNYMHSYPPPLTQVVSLQVRSNLLEGDGVIVPEGSLAHTRIGDKTKELPYLIILNRTLPQDIRVLGWSNVESSFSARFDCLARTYKYFFPLGQMDLEASVPPSPSPLSLPPI